MTDAGPWRRTIALGAAWIAAALIAGLPSSAQDEARAEPRVSKIPVVVNTGPECFAGKAVAPGPAQDH